MIRRRNNVFNTLRSERTIKEEEGAITSNRRVSLNKSNQSPKSSSQRTSTYTYSRNSTIVIIESFIESALYQLIMSLITIYILFADDIKMLSTDASADIVFSIICMIILAIFLIELVIFSIVLRGYFIGFNFWLDMILFITMLLDIHWFYAFFINQVSGVEKKAKTITSIIKAGKSAKIAARTIRILRIIRIIRLVRISKLYKAKERLIQKEEDKLLLQKSQEEQLKRQSSLQSTPSSVLTEGDIPQQSKIGKMLSELTTQRVILIVLLMILGIILFNSTLYYEVYSSMNYGIKVFSNFTSMNDADLNLTFNVYVKEHLDIANPLIFAQVGYLNYTSEVYNEVDLREEEKGIYSGDCNYLIPSDENNSVCYAIFDMRKANELSSILNIIKTIFVNLVLAIGTYFFSKDTTKLVLEPIEAIVDNIKLISKNPIQALIKAEKEEIKNLIIEEEEKGKYQGQGHGYKTMKHCSQLACVNILKSKEDQCFETVILQKTITKISNLLIMSYGEAGSEIISKNMLKTNTGDINPSLPGKEVYCIYCICSIDNFHYLASVTEEGIIELINAIADIIHEVTSEHCGSVNSNTGDSFIIIWKYDKGYTDYTNNKGIFNCEQVNALTDLALISYIKIMKKVYSSTILKDFKQRSGLNSEFQIKVSFGFDLGWGIEGAVGSQMKIDVGYFSPYLQRAHALQKNAELYKTSILMSDKFVEMLSIEAQNACRIIDIYNINTNTNPLNHSPISNRTVYFRF